MQLENLLVEQREEILVVRINRPKARNALDTQTLRELSEVLQKRTQDVKVVILGSSIDKVFVSGSDIREMEAMNALKFRNYVGVSPDDIRENTGYTHDYIPDEVSEIPLPTDEELKIIRELINPRDVLLPR